MELKIEGGLSHDLDTAVWDLVPLHHPFNHFTTQFNATPKTWKYIPWKSFFFFLVYNSNQPHIKTQSHLFLLTSKSLNFCWCVGVGVCACLGVCICWRCGLMVVSVVQIWIIHPMGGFWWLFLIGWSGACVPSPIFVQMLWVTLYTSLLFLVGCVNITV